MADESHPVFVYGTLRRGFSNHHFLRGARALGGARTVERYALYLCDFPCCYRHQADAHIKGELYVVNDAMLAVLDVLEEHPRVYVRDQVPVRLDSGKTVAAWLYFYPKKCGRLVPDGDISNL